jgi:hypothetical protein
VASWYIYSHTVENTIGSAQNAKFSIRAILIGDMNISRHGDYMYHANETCNKNATYWRDFENDRFEERLAIFATLLQMRVITPWLSLTQST